MGVTLERVQNKFACIIGELCSEPDVLSQFAIWVDLRIAEYKLKGAISLDCSGEDVSPPWLRGYKPPVKSRNRIGESYASPHQNALSPSQQRSWSQDASPSATRYDGLNSAVKTEHLDSDLFPVGIQRNENSRKRSHTDSNAQYLSHDMPMSKSPRYDHSLSPGVIAEPTNESLMSIIGMGDNGGSDNPSSSMDDPDISIVMDSHSQPHTQGTPKPSSVSTGGYRGDYSPSQPSTSSSDFSPGRRLHRTSSETTGNSWQLGMRYSHYDINSTMLRVPKTPVKTKQIVRNLASAVGTLERWMRQKYGDTRNIEDVPPSTLDKYFCEFFAAAKRHTGGSYSAKGLRNVRCSLTRFLEEIGYPCRITTAPEFRNSKEVFIRRCKELIAEQLSSDSLQPLSHATSQQQCGSSALNQQYEMSAQNLQSEISLVCQQSAPSSTDADLT